MSEGTEQPIIIKKKKGGHGHGHHGGAWKVAYADFVTAMMAFFLVMWIVGLNPSSKQRIASFFREPGVFSFSTGKKIPIDIDLGTGAKGNEGNGSSTEGVNPGASAIPDSVLSELSQAAREAVIEQAKADSSIQAQQVKQVSNEIHQSLEKMAEGKPEMQELLNSLQVSVSQDGMRIELMETRETLFFEVGSTQLTKSAISILQALASEIGKLNNTVSIEGHTDSRGYGNGKGGFSNWELSADRANSARRIMEANGLWSGQVVNVTGFADRRLRVPTNPFDVSNRRVSILVGQKTQGEFIQEQVEKITKRQAEVESEKSSENAEPTGHAKELTTPTKHSNAPAKHSSNSHGH